MAPIQAPKVATRQQCRKAKQYPWAIWRRGADGNMERIAMAVVQKEYMKLNRDIFAHDIPPMAQQMTKKWQRWNNKQ